MMARLTRWATGACKITARRTCRLAPAAFVAVLGGLALIAALPAWPAGNDGVPGVDSTAIRRAGSDSSAGGLSDILPDSIGVAGGWVGPVMPAERSQRIFELSHPHIADVMIPGERLVFSVRYGPLRAGEATMSIDGISVVKGDSCYHIVTTASSNDFFSAFFYVRDRVETFMDIHTLLPRRFEKHLAEGNYHNTEIVDMDHANQMAVYNGKQTVELWETAHDVLSAFYDVRTRDLAPDDVIYIDSHASRKNYPLEVHVLRRERIEVPAGKFNCLVVEPMLRTPGLFKQEGALTIWLTDDDRRVPVQMRSALPIGAISVVLTEMCLPEVPAGGAEPGLISRDSEVGQ